MEQENFPGQWTEDQWSLVQQTVRDEARKVRVAGSFLPRNGPWPSETDSVPTQELNDDTAFSCWAGSTRWSPIPPGC